MDNIEVIDLTGDDEAPQTRPERLPGAPPINVMSMVNTDDIDTEPCSTSDSEPEEVPTFHRRVMGDRPLSTLPTSGPLVEASHQGNPVLARGAHVGGEREFPERRFPVPIPMQQHHYPPAHSMPNLTPQYLGVPSPVAPLPHAAIPDLRRDMLPPLYLGSTSPVAPLPHAAIPGLRRALLPPLFVSSGLPNPVAHRWTNPPTPAVRADSFPHFGLERELDPRFPCPVHHPRPNLCMGHSRQPSCHGLLTPASPLANPASPGPRTFPRPTLSHPIPKPPQRVYCFSSMDSSMEPRPIDEGSRAPSGNVGAAKDFSLFDNRRSGPRIAPPLMASPAASRTPIVPTPTFRNIAPRLQNNNNGINGNKQKKVQQNLPTSTVQSEGKRKVASATVTSGDLAGTSGSTGSQIEHSPKWNTTFDPVNSGMDRSQNSSAQPHSLQPSSSQTPAATATPRHQWRLIGAPLILRLPSLGSGTSMRVEDCAENLMRPPAISNGTRPLDATNNANINQSPQGEGNGNDMPEANRVSRTQCVSPDITSFGSRRQPKKDKSLETNKKKN